MRKKTLVILLLALTLILCGLGAYFALRSDDKSGTIPEEPTETINYAPATEEEKAETEEHKNNLSDDTKSPSSTDGSNKQSVTPLITSAGQYDSPAGDQIEVRAYVPGIYESGGSCTVKITDGSQTVTRNVEGIRDATTTRCDVVAILRSEFPGPGTWTAQVTYSSAKSQGVSEKVTFEVE